MELDMRYLKTSMILASSLVLTVLLGLAGCGDDHGHRVYYEGDRGHDVYATPRYENERHDMDRHEERGGDSRREGEHGGR
jgi:hypothetical protein